MIIQLQHQQPDVAKAIYTVFQRSYPIEAALIGVSDFPPLKRTAADIAGAASDFCGFMQGQQLAAVIEIEVNAKHLEIHSLTVDPDFFRQGIAARLMDYVLSAFDIESATVETAAVNQPAITLYEKHGFKVFKQWVPDHGIEKVAMRLQIQT